MVTVKARRADIHVGGREPINVSKVGGSRDMLPWEKFKFKSSEMAINASKTANSDIDL